MQPAITTTFKVKISSKNQVTLPVSLLKQMGWQSGQVFNVLSNPNDNQVVLTSSSNVVEKVRTRLKKYRLPNIPSEKAIEITKKTKEKERFVYEN
jgi:bifunctional DNA-binding transcriptional regulator/antitoxin component of YhaV-PrlF toxin-antitoxin module